MTGWNDTIVRKLIVQEMANGWCITWPNGQHYAGPFKNHEDAVKQHKTMLEGPYLLTERDERA